MLPDLSAQNNLGVGVYWWDVTGIYGTNGDWNAPGYPTSIVRDPSKSILLCENAQGNNAAGNQWTCCCIGPKSTGVNDLAQMDSGNGIQNPSAGSGVNEGILLYKAQANRFNFAFCDGHVQALRMQDTIGSGTLTAPRGMWTVTGPY